MRDAKVFSLGSEALTIEFGNEISLELNERALRLARFFEKNSFAGFVEAVPAYASVTIFYDCLTVRKNYPNYETAFEAVKKFAENALGNLEKTVAETESRLMKIPVCFDEEFALDLEFVTTAHNLSTEQAKAVFLARNYRVFMLGFLPGFAYLGEVAEEIATPRKDEPRQKVPAGSVGIAGKQTGIYSLESPGGWQNIGRTPLKMFNPNSPQPTFLRAGDSIEFYEIDKDNFIRIERENCQL